MFKENQYKQTLLLPVYFVTIHSLSILLYLTSVPAQDLPPSEHLDPDMGFGDPYVKVSIEPGVDERVRQSSVKRKTANPFYNEYFKFPATYDDIRARAVVFVVYDYDKFSRHKLVGEVRIDLSKVETSNSVEMWCDIQKQKLVSNNIINEPIHKKGELCIL